MNPIAPKCNVWASSNVADDLASLLDAKDPKQVFLLMDEGSERHCRTLLSPVHSLLAENSIVIPSGDDAKDYRSALAIWDFLSSHGATRKAVLVNLGGGMPCDLGGFCASTFKRGIEFINIPTTLLSQVDASLGGKTGMNLGSLKNEIGVFQMASHVLICSDFLRSLDMDNLLSGFAEMIKHALIHAPEAVDRLLDFDFKNVDYALLHDYVAESIQIKNFFVEADPQEKGLRKALNFGHTFGHAFETFAMRSGNPVLHGFAVGWGMVCELLLCESKMGLDSNVVCHVCEKVSRLYGPHDVRGSEDALIELMTHDKKNDGSGINFTLLPSVGNVAINQIASEAEIRDVFARFADLQNHLF
ncbi:MAG: 3-dehydroquinate synthase [Bacteroidales bacterium]|jgi:3-dehydroquinate synthase|nr:3-dehydroquinate synthase [Bacteroidales bacterium]